VSAPPSIYLDADACPVKEHVYRVAARYGVPLFVVSNSPLRHPMLPDLEVKLVVAQGGLDAADDWIAERAGPGDVVVTGDIPLAARCLERGAQVVGHNGRPFTRDSIGTALASRALMADLRAMGVVSGGNAPMAKADRSRFLSALDAAIVAARRPR
jgi:uncharacterized protein YaiI (UPF0178 family)